MTVEKNGRRVVVVISCDEYDEFNSRRDAYWGNLAKKADRNGYIGTVKSLSFLKKSLHARG